MSESTRPENVTLLGATGSIGSSTLEVIRANPDRFRLFAVSARRSISLLAAIVSEFSPAVAVLCESELETVQPEEFAALKIAADRCRCELLLGASGLSGIAAAPETDVVVAGIVGAAGIDSVFAAARAGKRILLANKEALVMSGAVLIDTVRRNGAMLLPIDSEHNAIFQCLPERLQQRVAAGHGDLPHDGCDTTGRSAITAIWDSVSKIHLTASGGPFRGKRRADLAKVTPAQACRHPNWQMGQKISIDSATLMNKGLELIEACWLFDLEPAQIDVVIHPESIIHSMVEYVDGSVIAQLGAPDMKTPIASALGWPARIPSRATRLDLFALSGLHFEPPDHEAFPCLDLARMAFNSGGASPAILNAANEVAVQRFIEGRIGFLDIAKVIRQALDSCIIEHASTLEEIVDADARSRACAELVVNGLS